MNEKDYYALLGVPHDADKRAIQKAFQAKARTLHPDVNHAPDAEERFKEVSEAYAVLSDDAKRARYDAMRSGSPFVGTPGRASQGFGGGDGFGGFPFGMPFDMSGFSQPRAVYSPRAGADIVIELDLSPAEARAGVRRGLTYQKYESCEVCGGSGSTSSEHAHPCPTCSGTGSISVDLSFLFGGGAAQMRCPECGGSGRVIQEPCSACAGTGRHAVTSELVVEFAADTHDGDVIRRRGEGHAGTNGAAPGDLIVRARVAAERLEGRALRGFSLTGIALPFLGLGLIPGMAPILVMMSLIPLIAGIAGILSAEPFRRPLLWWRRGAKTLLQGAANSLMWAFILATLSTCMHPGVNRFGS
ncbi:DnaJ domain-containing protein [Collinsella sp. AGMB00827]|uniref:DnaJ domain-containing protein n=1 Tax=Collinsella ureilytica TaxID=2869515 RepID=A0ABS7MKT1_9ACTN|nr:DnaJ domain-containing protein [Collinsella urealyticum]MBY4797971.1 DnaJ domain-containing protein [Collinsella urealyticum]